MQEKEGQHSEPSLGNPHRSTPLWGDRRKGSEVARRRGGPRRRGAGPGVTQTACMTGPAKPTGGSRGVPKPQNPQIEPPSGGLGAGNPAAAERAFCPFEETWKDWAGPPGRRDEAAVFFLGLSPRLSVICYSPECWATKLLSRFDVSLVLLPETALETLKHTKHPSGGRAATPAPAWSRPRRK